MNIFVGALVFVAIAYGAIEIVDARNVATQAVPRLIDTRIVGGKTANIISYPHQVSLRYKSIFYPTNPRTHRCGGSIASNRIIITAAHCIIDSVASQLHIAAGTNNRMGGDGYISPVQEIIMHENYDPTTFVNDIALLVLGAPLPLNDFTMKAIDLNDQSMSAGVMVTVTGWGTTQQGGLAAELLQEVNVPIVSNEVCNEDYRGLIHESMLCAGYRGVGGKDACQGDSGGPLIVNGKLVGVVSWGQGCAQPDYPGVYSNVTYLRPWLLEKMAAINSQLNKEI